MGANGIEPMISIGLKLDPDWTQILKDSFQMFVDIFSTLRKARSDKRAEQRSCLNIDDERRRPCWIGWNA
jgi:hypothetical protein